MHWILCKTKVKLIKPSIEIIEQQPGLQGIYEQIELAGRTCYKSEPKYEYFDLNDRPNQPIDRYINNGFNITNEDAFKKGLVIRISSTAEDFVNRMVKSGHGAMLEHGTVYLTYRIDYNSNTLSNGYDENLEKEVKSFINKYYSNKYSKVNHYNIHYANYIAITTNYRVLVENNWLDDLQYLCEPTEYHEKHITVKFTTQIAITREINRHRANSMAESSTRFCNYNKDKFNNSVNINLPTFINEEDVMNGKSLSDYCRDIYHNNTDDYTPIDYWYFANMACAYSYHNLIDLGWKPEQARTILPLDTNTELIHTAFISDWEHFLSLRSPKYGAKGVHSDAAYLADKIYDEFKKLNII